MNIRLETITPPANLAYLAGCRRCEHGRKFAMPLKEARLRYPPHLTLPDLLLRMWRDGLWTWCSCEAGTAAQRTLEKNAQQIEEAQAALRLEIEGQAQRRFDRTFSDAQVPPRFAELSFKGFYELAGSDPGKREAIQRIREHFEHDHCETLRGRRYGILLYGKSDMGKTGALCPLFTHHVRHGTPGLWVQYNDLLAALRDFESGQVQERIKAAQHADLLFIDDFGDPAADRVATDYTRDVVFRILDHRNNYAKPTLITSNLAPEKMTGQFHERIVKRLSELCVIVEVAGIPMRELVDVAEQTARRCFA